MICVNALNVEFLIKLFYESVVLILSFSVMLNTLNVVKNLSILQKTALQSSTKCIYYLKVKLSGGQGMSNTYYVFV